MFWHASRTRPVLGEHGRRGAGQPLPADRARRDSEPGEVAHGVAESAHRRLRRRLGEAQQSVLRDYKSILRPEAGGGRRRLPGSALALLRSEDLRASQLAEKEQHKLLLGPVSGPNERGRVVSGRRRSGKSTRFRHRHCQGAAAQHYQVQLALAAR